MKEGKKKKGKKLSNEVGKKERREQGKKERGKEGRKEEGKKKTQISILTVLSMLLLAPVTFRGFCFENPA